MKLMKIKVITFVSIWCLWLERANLRILENPTGQLQVSFQFESIQASRMRFGTVTVIVRVDLGRILEANDLHFESSQLLFHSTHQITNVCQIECSSAQTSLKQTFLKSCICSLPSHEHCF